MDLKNKNAVVTGSTRGIGLAIAKALVAEGANLVISARQEDDVRKTATELAQRAQGTVIGQPCDVRDEQQVQHLIQRCVNSLGGMDILVNNAGIGVFGQVEQLSPQQWRDTLATNLDGVFYACHHAVPEMKRGGGGFIINIGSLAGKNAFAGGAAYNASKFGLIGFSEALMQEVRHDDIQVAYVMPGSVETDFGRPSEGDQSWKLSPSDVADVVLQTLKHPGRCLTSRIEMRPSKPPK